jgi:hypothetical protein
VMTSSAVRDDDVGHVDAARAMNAGRLRSCRCRFSRVVMLRIPGRSR